MRSFGGPDEGAAFDVETAGRIAESDETRGRWKTEKTDPPDDSRLISSVGEEAHVVAQTELG